MGKANVKQITMMCPVRNWSEKTLKAAREKKTQRQVGEYQMH